MTARRAPAARCLRTGRPWSFLLVMLLPATPPAAAQVPAGLQFLGFEPGMSRAALEAEFTRLGAAPACTTAAGGALVECLAVLPPGRAGPDTPALEVRAVLREERAAIVLVRGALSAAELERWGAALHAAYGPGRVRLSGGQPTREWVRQRTMLRLTRRGATLPADVSVSLVHGPLLDGRARGR